ncbi:hypothetical protein [Phaeodactylibacter xiamenensis]|uniref:hypothetical protein n=1 Tax=Phaeodactylibacter xiamenensis TaxID=1524460 RepID=UPI0024A7B0A9|nr:hypothetical protein [Phaeodactylibacter xiamenensis]
MSRFIYIRGLRQVEHTVFGVSDGQKHYWDALTNKPQPYSSGQQVKRSILDAMVESMDGERRAPITFNYQLKKAKAGEVKQSDQKEPWNPCDPKYADQLIGGWMRAQKGATAVKRRSPLSISAMRPLHPSLARLEDSESGTFDRSDQPGYHKVRVTDEKGNELSPEEIKAYLTEADKTLPMRNWLKLGPRANGLFVFDIAVDLTTLFSVSTNQYDPEITEEQIAELKDEGWREVGERLYAPTERQSQILKALAKAIVNWRITSNQSRTFSPQGTLALAVSNNANSIINAIRADIVEDATQPYKAAPVIDDSIDGVELFLAPAVKGFVSEVVVDGNAMNNAEQHILQELQKGIMQTS